MEVHQLRYFVATAEAGTMSRAAHRCNVAQPSLSQQIQKLERSLGVQLFDRLGRGVVLTAEGRALLPRARQILAEIQDIETSLRSDLEEGGGRLALGAIPTIGPYLLPQVLAALRQEFPRADLEVREDLTENLVEALVDARVDVAVVSSPVDHDLVELEVVGQEKFLVALPENMQVRHKDDVTMDELRELPRITLNEMHCLGQQISDFCNLTHVGQNIVCHATQLSTVLELVRLGLGVSIVPSMAVRSGGKDRILRLRHRAAQREIAIAWRRGRSRSRVARRMAELVADQVGGRSPVVGR